VTRFEPGSISSSLKGGIAMIWTVSMKSDKDRYTTQQCKNDGCEREFKVAFNQGSAKPIAFCPYCGKNVSQYWTVEQMKYLDCMALNKLKDPKAPCAEPDESGGPSNQQPTSCADKHDEKIKHDGADPKPSFCIICGKPT
jgi:hypothetical protein